MRITPKNIKNFRKSQNLTIREFANKLNLEGSIIYEEENGIKPIKDRTVSMLVKVFNITKGQLSQY